MTPREKRRYIRYQSTSALVSSPYAPFVVTSGESRCRLLVLVCKQGQTHRDAPGDHQGGQQVRPYVNACTQQQKINLNHLPELLILKSCELERTLVVELEDAAGALGY